MQNTLPAFVDDLCEDLELWRPKLRVEEAGYAVRAAGPERRVFAGKHGYPAARDPLIADACGGDLKILKGKRPAGSPGIKDDLENAGAIRVNEPVVVDGNLISSRAPRSLAPFGKALVDFPDRSVQ